MQITLGCSIDEYRKKAEYQSLPIINIENPLFPGYLDGNLGEDIYYLQITARQSLVIDGPYIDLNLGSPEPQIHRLAIEKVLEALDFARQVSADEIVFLSTFLPFIKLPSYERSWIEESLRSWQTILDTERGLRISLCNTFEYTPTYLLEIVRRINRPNLGLGFDVGHCLVWGRLTPAQWYSQIRPWCRVIYLHSNNGEIDEHQSIRTGLLADTSMLSELCSDLRTDSIVILKYFDKNRVLEDIKFLADICDNPS